MFASFFTCCLCFEDLELCVRPRAHLRNGLSEKEALDAILDEISLLEEELPIKTRVIVCIFSFLFQ